MKKYNVVLVGCGYIGAQHLEDIYYRDNINIFAVVDIDESRAKAFAQKYGAESFGTDYKDFVSLDKTDIVIVATNVDTHFSITEYALSHEKHVLCEKPIASSYEEGKKFCELVKNSSSKVLVAHILRHNKSYQKIRDLISQDAIGDLKLIRVVQNHHAIDWPRYQRLLADCSPAVDCGVHYFDVMQWFSGSPIVSVTGFDTSLDEDCAHNNYNVVLVKMENGCTGYYEGGWSKNLPYSNQKLFVGTKGYIKFTLKHDRISNQEEGDLIEMYLSETGEYKTINVNTPYKNMYAQISALIDMIENNSPPTITIDEVLNSFKVAKTAEYSMEHTAATPIDTLK